MGQLRTAALSQGLVSKEMQGKKVLLNWSTLGK